MRDDERREQGNGARVAANHAASLTQRLARPRLGQRRKRRYECEDHQEDAHSAILRMKQQAKCQQDCCRWWRPSGQDHGYLTVFT